MRFFVIALPLIIYMVCVCVCVYPTTPGASRGLYKHCTVKPSIFILCKYVSDVFCNVAAKHPWRYGG